VAGPVAPHPGPPQPGRVNGEVFPEPDGPRDRDEEGGLGEHN